MPLLLNTLLCLLSGVFHVCFFGFSSCSVHFLGRSLCACCWCAVRVFAPFFSFVFWLGSGGVLPVFCGCWFVWHSRCFSRSWFSLPWWHSLLCGASLRFLVVRFRPRVGFVASLVCFLLSRFLCFCLASLLGGSPPFFLEVFFNVAIEGQISLSCCLRQMTQYKGDKIVTNQRILNLSPSKLKLVIP